MGMSSTLMLILRICRLQRDNSTFFSFGFSLLTWLHRDN